MAVDMLHVLRAARDADLWREKDGTTREYRHEHFGYFDYLRDLTDETAAAAEAGLIELRGTVGRWAPTKAGLAELDRTELEESATNNPGPRRTR